MCCADLLERPIARCRSTFSWYELAYGKEIKLWALSLVALKHYPAKLLTEYEQISKINFSFFDRFLIGWLNMDIIKIKLPAVFCLVLRIKRFFYDLGDQIPNGRLGLASHPNFNNISILHHILGLMNKALAC